MIWVIFILLVILIMITICFFACDSYFFQNCSKKIKRTKRKEYYDKGDFYLDRQFDITKWFVGYSIFYFITINQNYNTFWYIGIVASIVTIFLEFLDYTSTAHLYEKCANELKEINTTNLLSNLRYLKYLTLSTTFGALFILIFNIYGQK